MNECGRRTCLFWEEDIELSFRHVELEVDSICKSLEPRKVFQVVNVDQDLAASTR